MNFSLPKTLSFSGPSAGLVIRAKEVEVLSMRGKTVVSQACVPVEGGDEQHLVQAIQRAVEAASLKTKRIAVAIPNRDVLFRFFTMPNLPKSEWDTAVQFESRKYIPFKPETLVWDYRATPPSGGTDQMDVIFSAIPRDVFSQMQALLATAGIEPTRIEPSSLSLARLLEPEKGAPANEFVCLVDIEEATAHLAIVKDRMPYLTRDIELLQSPDLPIPIPGQGEAPPPLAELSAPVPGAGEDVAAPQAGAEQEAGAIESRAERLLSELSVSMDFFVREHPATTIARVVLCGDETRIGPWCQRLSDQLHRPVELGSALLERRVQGELPLSFASAVGLLQASKGSDGTSLDFLKRSAAKAPGARPAAAVALSTASFENAVSFLKTPRALAGIGMAVGLLVAVWGYGAVQISSAKQMLAGLIQERQLGGTLNRMTWQELEPVEMQARTQLGMLRRLLSEPTSMAARLDALVRSLPEGVWLTGLQFSRKLSPNGTSEVQMSLRGACYRENAGLELQTIQEFGEQIKLDPAIFEGLATARLNRINEVEVNESALQYSYRTFQLDCDSERRL